jgi:hypothetical protein
LAKKKKKILACPDFRDLEKFSFIKKKLRNKNKKLTKKDFEKKIKFFAKRLREKMTF